MAGITLIDSPALAYIRRWHMQDGKINPELGLGQLHEIEGRGFLKGKQLEYLKSRGEGFDQNQQRNYRFEIRKNIQNSLIDFGYLHHLGPVDLHRALSPINASFGYKTATKPLEMIPELREIQPEPSDRGAAMALGMVDLLAYFHMMLYQDGAENESEFFKLIKQGIGMSRFRTMADQMDYNEAMNFTMDIQIKVNGKEIVSYEDI